LYWDVSIAVIDDRRELVWANLAGVFVVGLNSDGTVDGSPTELVAGVGRQTSVRWTKAGPDRRLLQVVDESDRVHFYLFQDLQLIEDHVSTPEDVLGDMASSGERVMAVGSSVAGLGSMQILDLDGTHIADVPVPDSKGAFSSRMSCGMESPSWWCGG
jgi:hypothetical protein